MSNKISQMERVTSLLLQDLRYGRYANATMLPAEVDIAAEYSISRTMVRDCLAVLDREGFITRKHGIGTIINHDVLSIPVRIDLEQEFWDMVKAAGCQPSVHNVSYQEINAPDIAAKMHLENTKFLAVERTIYADDNPEIYCTDHIPISLVLNHDYDLSTFSAPIFSFLQTHCKQKVSFELSNISAISADNKTGAILHVESGYPLLHLEEVGHDALNQPILFSSEYYADKKIHHVIFRKKI